MKPHHKWLRKRRESEMFVAAGVIAADQIWVTVEWSRVKKWSPRVTPSSHEVVYWCPGVQVISTHTNNFPSSHQGSRLAYVQTTEYESFLFRCSTSDVFRLERFPNYCKFHHYSLRLTENRTEPLLSSHLRISDAGHSVKICNLFFKNIRNKNKFRNSYYSK